MKITLSTDDYHDLEHASEGVCLACGVERSMCEPDARNYECWSCGEHKVFGPDELLYHKDVTWTD